MPPLTRRSLLHLVAGAAAGGALGSLGGEAQGATLTAGARAVPTTPTRQPALFVGHGNPMNALEENRWSQGFRQLATLLPRPRAILAISAHWFVEGSHLTGAARPETIHDFSGFPSELYRVQYPAPGDPALAAQVVGLLGARRASVVQGWGLDHGTWSVLVHLRPAADVPVVQLSLDASLAPAEHLALGRALAPLRDEGVLVLGSGNVTHNLRHAFGAWHRGETATPAWASSFDAEVARAFEQRDATWLAGALASEAGRLAHPTPDHYLPLLYVAGAAGQGGAVSSPIQGFDMASLSMRSLLVS